MDSLSGFGGSGSQGGGMTSGQKQQLMEQVKAQIAVANAQELLQVLYLIKKFYTIT